MAAVPPPLTTNPLRKMVADVQSARAATIPFPPGDMTPSMSRTRQMVVDPLPLLLDLYERYGPVFSTRILHAPVVFLLGPEANHHVLVSNAKNFVWRQGSFRDLIPLLGDSLLTTDGLYHRTTRKLLLPAFHVKKVAESVDTMIEETDVTLRGLHAGDTIDVYDWTRHLALRIAMRALLGIDPDSRANGHDPADEWEAALSYYGRDLFLQSLRGPGTPWARMQLGHDRLEHLIRTELAARRSGEGAAAERGGIVSMLMDATHEDGSPIADEEIRDHVLTLLFAGHDTTTATITFLLYELTKNRHELPPLLEELDRVLQGNPPTAEQLVNELPRLDMAVDEVLRMYPPAWIGPRRSLEPFTIAGTDVPGGIHVNYVSWASHRLPEWFPDPHTFKPERFAPEAKAALPKGAYVPFGGGSRTCIGMRFGLMEVKAIAALFLQRFDFELQPGYEMKVRQTPTLGPRNGMPIVVRPRQS